MQNQSLNTWGKEPLYACARPRRSHSYFTDPHFSHTVFNAQASSLITMVTWVI